MEQNDPQDLPGTPRRRPLVRLLRRLWFIPIRLWNNFTREKVVNGIKALAWVGPLTILIWVYAERQQTGTPSFSDVAIQFTSTNSKYYITPSGLPPPVVTLDVEGPQGGLDKVKLQLSAVPRSREIDLGNSLSKGNNQNVNILERLRNDPLFKENGVTVTKSTPAQIPVDVDYMVDMNVPVEIPAEVANLATATVFEPREVHVRVPETIVQAGGIKVLAVIPSSVAQLPPGPQSPMTVLVEVKNSAGRKDGITVSPGSVKATFEIRPADVEGVLGSIAINVQASTDTLKNYDIVLTGKTSISNLHVIGPKTQVDLATKNWHLAKGILEVPGTAKMDDSRPLRYDFAPEVKDLKVKPDDASQPISYKLVKRDATATE